MISDFICRPPRAFFKLLTCSVVILNRHSRPGIVFFSISITRKYCTIWSSKTLLGTHSALNPCFIHPNAPRPQLFASHILCLVLQGPIALLSSYPAFVIEQFPPSAWPPDCSSTPLHLQFSETPKLSFCNQRQLVPLRRSLLSWALFWNVSRLLSHLRGTVIEDVGHRWIHKKLRGPKQKLAMDPSPC